MTEPMKTKAAGKRIAAAGLCAVLGMTGCSSSKPSATLTPQSFQNREELKLPARHGDDQRAGKPRIQASVATTRPAVGVSLGGYQTVGGVVAEVNGNPIYANKVLKLVRAALAARATELNESQFRDLASAEIKRKIQGLERDELVFGAADRNLQGDDRKFAEFLTMQFRTQKITEAGGSPELAVRKAAADEDDFDELVTDQYRKYMTEVFYRKKVLPRIQISADDLREYYNHNRDSEFTQLDEVSFRMIKIDTRARSKADAQQRAQEILTKAKTGDFADLARTMNDDPRLARSGGDQGSLKRGSFLLEQVEKALWDTPVDGVTPIIQDSGGLYIAKVTARKVGNVQGFDAPGVQEAIRRTLWSRQFRDLTDEIDRNLRQNSMVREGNDMTQIAVEMALQNYPLWSGQKNP